MNEAVQGQAKSITHQKSYHHQIQYIYLYAVAASSSNPRLRHIPRRHIDFLLLRITICISLFIQIPNIITIISYMCNGFSIHFIIIPLLFTFSN